MKKKRKKRLIKLNFWYLTLQSLGNICIMAYSRSSSKKFLNFFINACFFFFPGNWIPYVFFIWYQNAKKNYKFYLKRPIFSPQLLFFLKGAQTANDQFWVSNFLGIKSTCIIGSKNKQKSTYNDVRSLGSNKWQNHIDSSAI
jgi:hypothetical protein